MNEETLPTKSAPPPPNLPTEEDILLPDKKLTIEAFEGTIPPDPEFASKILREEEKKKEIPLRDINQIAKTSSPPKTVSTEKKTQHIRTYQGDVAEALQKGKTSLVQMVMKEQERKVISEKTTSPKNPKNLSFLIASGLLIILGLGVIGGGLYFAFLAQKDGGETQTQGPRQSPLLFTETAKEINVTGFSRDRFIRTLSEETLSFAGSLDSIQYLSFVEDIPRTQGGIIKGYAGAKDFFELSGARLPSALLRSLGEEFVFGIHVFNGNTAFLILTTDFYENTFAGMLEWESFMPEDLLPLFGKQIVGGTSFVDTVIKNRDVRILETSEGEVLLAYLFLNRQTLIIAETIDTLDEVITRLQRPQR